MSKSKENVPAHDRSRTAASKVSLTAAAQGDEFFTDSILESDATRTSKIPTPKPQKETRARSRRVRQTNKVSLGGLTNKHTSSGTEHVDEQYQKSNLQPPIIIRKSKSPSPLRTRIAATPPHRRHESQAISPVTDLQSPPPREFTDVYRQIADEEDLAATERELSDSDESQADYSETEPAIVIHQQLPTHHRPDLRPVQPRSRGSTPTQQHMDHTDKNTVSHSIETMSEPTGMSFLNELSDQRLAAILTPHMSESAKDRAKLREVWSNQKPVAFTIVRKTSPNGVQRIQDSAVSAPRLKAFSKADRWRSISAENDQSPRPTSRHSDGSIENYPPSYSSWHDQERPLKPLPTNARVERNFNFSRRHGFPLHRGALTEQNLEQQNHGSHSQQENKISSPAASHMRVNSISDYSDRAQKVREVLVSPTTLRDPPIGDILTSRAELKNAAGIPRPSENNGPTTPGTDTNEVPSPRPISPDKTKRWDIDLTGHSIQVSESPPVRNKIPLSDGSLGKEIQSLSKRAVTTSRLGEIRERQSQEQLRSTSKSPAPRSSSTSSDKRRQSLNGVQQNNVNQIGEPVPNTPVVIFRSSSSSSKVRDPIEKGNGSRSTSDDFLQRFARAVSNTPKSSPPSIPPAGSVGEEQGRQIKIEEGVSKKSLETRPSSTKPDTNPALKVAETPRVVGAWTDTILPDTVRTAKQPTKVSTYAQTPHVSAGGWVDTPAPLEMKFVSKELTPIVEAVPEELTNGIVRSKVEASEDYKVQIKDTLPQAEASSEMPKVGLAGILDRAKQRLTSQEAAVATRDNDTLNLGNETIESLQDLLTLDADEFTMLSKVFNEDEEGPELKGAQEEAAILERIGTKLDRLRSNIHEARKGISQLEHKVSQPVSSLDDVSKLSSTTVCGTCKQMLHSPTHTQSHGVVIPVTPVHVTLSVPLLFHMEPKSSTTATKTYFGFRIPRPTPLGWITLTIWLWYIVECTLAEIYSRPTHAEYYVWPSPRYAEPEFPYVLPTMLSRWFQLDNIRGILALTFGWLFTLSRAVFRIGNMLLGLTDGFVDPTAGDQAGGSPGLSASSVMNKILATASSAAWGGSETAADLSMMNDEYI